MSFAEIIGLTVALIVMFVGLAGAVLPGLPSTPIVLIAAIGHRLYFGENGPSTWVLIVLGALTLFSLVMEFLASMVGARKLGATRKGIFGAVLGAIVGFFFGFAGIIIGPFAGAMLFELLGGRTFRESSRAGLGAVLGLIAGALGKVACCLAMIGVFTLNVLLRSFSHEPEPANGAQVRCERGGCVQRQGWLSGLPVAQLSSFASPEPHLLGVTPGTGKFPEPADRNVCPATVCRAKSRSSPCPPHRAFSAPRFQSAAPG